MEEVVAEEVVAEDVDVKGSNIYYHKLGQEL